MPSQFELVSTILFAIAILHTFSVGYFKRLADRFREGSVGENFFHLLSEIEVVFGAWAGILILYVALTDGGKVAVELVESRNFTEPAFVFVIMVISASKPSLHFVRQVLGFLAKILPLKSEMAFFVTAMAVGPLLGSFFTEPAAMTVTALLLRERFFDREVPVSFKYAALGTLFVNVSIGGVLTPYAAPPVIMVAGTWGWDLTFMLRHFGEKATLAVLLNTLVIALMHRKTLNGLSTPEKKVDAGMSPPWWLVAITMAFIAMTVVTAHHMTVFLGGFLFFLGVATITQEYQEELKLREGLLVGFFLGGLVVLGGPQKWWLEQILPHLQPLSMFVSSIGLTAVFDNAALTYLGAQVPHLSDALKFSLVAGAVTGGGLTVIANAPNPVGFGILRPTFPSEAISPMGLLRAALLPTLIAAVCFWFLPL